MKIYVASSWRNMYQPEIVRVLRAIGHEVFDFRNPPDSPPFHWGLVVQNWRATTPENMAELLGHPMAVAAYQTDKAALDWADACVLVMPSGRSACFEAGYMQGQGKKLFCYLPEQIEPELMLSAAEFISNMGELEDIFEAIAKMAISPIASYSLGKLASDLEKMRAVKPVYSLYHRRGKVTLKLASSPNVDLLKEMSYARAENRPNGTLLIFLGDLPFEVLPNGYLRSKLSLLCWKASAKALLPHKYTRIMRNGKRVWRQVSSKQLSLAL